MRRKYTDLSCFLARNLKLRIFGELKYFLGIEVARSKNGTFTCQRKYTLDLLQEMGMVRAKPVEKSIEQNHGLCSDNGKLLGDPSLYQRLVGRLIYPVITQPDVHTTGILFFLLSIQLFSLGNLHSTKIKEDNYLGKWSAKRLLLQANPLHL